MFVRFDLIKGIDPLWREWHPGPCLPEQAHGMDGMLDNQPQNLDSKFTQLKWIKSSSATAQDSATRILQLFGRIPQLGFRNWDSETRIPQLGFRN